VLVHQGLKPFLEFWRRHLLPLVKATAVSTCTVALHPVIRAGTEKITVAHAILLMGNARREASELPTMAGLGRRKKVKANISAQVSSRLDLRLAGTAAKLDLEGLRSHYAGDSVTSTALTRIISSYVAVLDDQSKLPTLDEAIHSAPQQLANLIPNAKRVLEQKQDLNNRLLQTRSLLQ